MERRVFVKLASTVAAWPLASWAQQPKGNTRRIGWLEPGTPASFPARREAFHKVMRDAGFVEGQNLVVDHRYSHGKIEQLPALAADPVKEGLVASMARPGGNITGMVGIAWELAGKRLELLREVAPKAARIAVLFDPRTAAGHAHVKETEAAARTLKLQLQLLEVKEPADLDKAFKAARSARAEALFIVAPGMLNSHRARIVGLAIEARLPSISSNVEFVGDGALMGYAPNLADNFRRVATYVDRILKGAKPSDLPIEQPTQFELWINLKTAKAIGLAIPKSILGRADRVIE
jgi:putative ABC transport system substrate-binding protein